MAINSLKIRDFGPSIAPAPGGPGGVSGGAPPGIFLKKHVVFDPLRAILGPKTYKNVAINLLKIRDFEPSFTNLLL